MKKLGGCRWGDGLSTEWMEEREEGVKKWVGGGICSRREGVVIWEFEGGRISVRNVDQCKVRGKQSLRSG